MTDKELISNACDLLSEHCLMFEDEIEKIWAIFQSLEPPPGSIEVRIAVASDGHHRVSFPIDGGRSGSEAMDECRASLVRDCTHSAIVRAWIPPVATPEVRGRVE